MAAALAAARSGAPVWLVERRAEIGGTVAHALIHTLGGLFDRQQQPLNPGLPAELVDRLRAADRRVGTRRMGRTCVLSVHPETYQRVAQEMLRGEANIRLLPRTTVRQVECSGGRICHAELQGPSGPLRLPVRSVIDATGGAYLVRLVDPQLVEEDEQRAAGGLIFRLSGAPPGALDFPHGLALVRSLRQAAAQGELPPTCQQAWIDQGIDPGEIYVKLFAPRTTVDPVAGDESPLPPELESERLQVIDFLRRQPGLEHLHCVQVGTIGVRDGGRVRGVYRLTGDDVRQGARFEDAAARGCWPIEYWDPDTGLALENLPGDGQYDIPLRSLTVGGFHNLWVAGKCLSADRLAHASARVVGTCWAMGQAVGRAAASAPSFTHL
jgi:hypothetical protein